MKVVSFHKTKLMRQATEATRIQMMEGGNILNRRGESGQNLPPKLVIDDPTGGTTNALKNHKRKVEQSMAPQPVPEATTEGSDPQDIPAPAVLVEANALDGGVQRKRARIAARVREQKRTGVTLAPAKSKSRSIKDMIQEMNTRKQNGSNRKQDDIPAVSCSRGGQIWGSGVW